MQPRYQSWAHPACGLPRAGSHFQHALELQRRHLELGCIGKYDDDKAMTTAANQLAQTWHLRHNELLFTTTPREGEDMAYHEIPRMVEELGMPPAEFIQRSNFPRLHFDDYRKGTGGCPATRPTPSQKRLIPSETTPVDFVAFMKKMLTWLPEERQSAEQLFGDAWLNS